MRPAFTPQAEEADAKVPAKTGHRCGCLSVHKELVQQGIPIIQRAQVGHEGVARQSAIALLAAMVGMSLLASGWAFTEADDR